MTTFYGSLAGASYNPANIIPVLADKGYARTTNEVIVRDTIALAAAAAGSLIFAAQLGWETILDPYDCQISFGALGASTTISFGDATYPAALDAAFSTVTATGAKQLLSAQAISAYGQPLWQQLGYASLAAAQAVGLQAVLYFTIGGAAATGQVTWRLVGDRRI